VGVPAAAGSPFSEQNCDYLVSFQRVATGMAKKTSVKKLWAAVEAEQKRLYEILDLDPVAAVEAARNLRAGGDLGETNADGLRAIIFIEAGGKLKDPSLVTEGIEIFGHPSFVKEPDSGYNLANGLAELARLQGLGKPGRLDMAESLQEVRKLLQEAADKSRHATVRSSSLNNLANELKYSYRWIEAYDKYVDAIGADPANAVALSGITSLLKWRLKQRVEAEGPIRRAAVRYLLRAHAQLRAAHSYAGPGGVTRIEELLKEFKIDETSAPAKEPPPVSDYAAFVRRHRLALCVDAEGVGADDGRWDHLAIRSVTQSIKAKGAPEIFASWNVLKADFLAARWLAYTALEAELLETGAYTDTLDYAQYGIRASLLVFAQKAAVDVLDKVAAAANVYLDLGHDPKAVYFSNCWHERAKVAKGQPTPPVRWLKPVASEISAGNSALVALAELAYDFQGGYLRAKKLARHAGTHRLVVLHDLWIEGRATESMTIERHKHDEFRQMVIESLQVARAALFYFQEVVSGRERRLRSSRTGLVGHLVLPSHHYIRKED
jgi:hypothetical protein